MNTNLKAINIFIAAWLVPGLGHFLQNKRLKGIVFLTGIGLLLAFGLIMEGKFYDTKQMHPLLPRPAGTISSGPATETLSALRSIINSPWLIHIFQTVMK